MITIKKTKLGKIPKIAIAVTDKGDSKLIKSLYVDILEIRVDQFKKLDSNYVRGVIASKKKIGVPLILTVRSKEEGGQKGIADEIKLNIFKENISSVDAVDIELNSPILTDIVKLAKKNKKVIIISWHNFKSTPNEKFLKTVLIKAKKSGAHVVKIAAKANRIDDVIKLAEFTRENKAKNLIVISLGGIGSISRLLFPMFGSLITYAYIKKPSGLGQVPLEDLRDHLRLYYPQYNQHYVAKSGIIEYA